MRKPKRTNKLKRGSRREKFLIRFGKHIEEFEAFKRATEAVNLETKRSYKGTLPAYFLFLDEDPDTVIVNRQRDIQNNDMLNMERYERRTKAYVQKLESENRIVQAQLGRIQGFFTNNSKRLSLDLGNLKYNKGRKKRKYSPCRDDVLQMIKFADSARDRFIVAVAFQNGFLPVDIASLRIGEYPGEPWVYFERSRSKTGEIQRAVSTPDTCRYLREYLPIRRGKAGEFLLMGREGPVDNETISQILRSTIEKAGLAEIPGFLPKCLRDGFEDAMVDANINRKIKEALMGHTGDIEHEYGSNKNMERRLVDAVKQVYPLISLTIVAPSDSSPVNMSAEQLELIAGLIANKLGLKLQ